MCRGLAIKSRDEAKEPGSPDPRALAQAEASAWKYGHGRPDPPEPASCRLVCEAHARYGGHSRYSVDMARELTNRFGALGL
jgi:hypothetical protein